MWWATCFFGMAGSATVGLFALHQQHFVVVRAEHAGALAPGDQVADHQVHALGRKLGAGALLQVLGLGGEGHDCGTAAAGRRAPLPGRGRHDVLGTFQVEREVATAGRSS